MSSKIVNFPQNYIIQQQDFTDTSINDIYARFSELNSASNVIFNGFNLNSAGGLTVAVGAGSAKGRDIPFTIDGIANQVRPCFVRSNSQTPLLILCPDNSTGYIVLNVNIWGVNQGNPQTLTPGYTNNSNWYEMDFTTDSTMRGAQGAVYVNTLLPSGQINSTYPYTQIVLAKVVTANGVISSIDQTYRPQEGVFNRALDFGSILSMFATSGIVGVNTFGIGSVFDSGNAPTLANQLTNKAYVDGANVLNSTGYKTSPGGYIEQWTNFTIPASKLTKSASNPFIDYWTLPGIEYVTFNFPIPFPNQLLGCHAYVLQSPFSGQNLGPLAYSEGGGTTSQINIYFVSSVATGGIPDRDLIISVKVWGN